MAELLPIRPGARALLPHHQAMLDASGISPEVAAARGYFTATTKAELERLGFGVAQRLAPALVIPVRGVTGEVVTYQARPDHPRVKDGKPLKYETPGGSSMALDVPSAALAALGNPSVPLFVTEGGRKADSAVSVGLSCIAVLGVWNWRGSNQLGGKTALPDWEFVALNGRQVYIVFDSDVMTKPAVNLALARLGGFLKMKGAEVLYVYLPAGPGAAKVGLDDYLATGHAVDDLLALAVPVLRVPVADDDQTEADYEERDGCIYWNTTTRDGDRVPRLLANFTARIVAEVDEHDGLEAHKTYEVEARRSGRTRRFRVSAHEFAGLGWIARELDASACVEPGLMMRDRVSHGIRRLSGEIPARRVITHTGWTKVGEEWAYLTHGCAIGSAGLVSGVEVALPEDLRHYHLPAPPEGRELVAAVEASLAVLEVAERSVTFALLGTVYRAALGNAGFTAWLEGASGERKTAMAVVAQQHWGAGFGERALPASWSSTGNALEDAAFIVKDSLLVVDDYAPPASRSDADRMATAADRLLRAQGNGSARGRLRADGGRRPGHPPRGLILATGEDLPRGNSIRGRTLVLEVSKGSARLDRLTVVQEHARRGLLAGALAGFVRWLAGRFDSVRSELRQREELARQRFTLEGQHARGAPNLASVYVGFEVFLEFAEAVEAVTAARAVALRADCQAALLELGRGQAAHHRDSEPASRFLRLVSSAIASGRAHIAGADGKPPPRPERFGWQTDGLIRASGERVGWIDGADVLLEPAAAHRVASKMASEEGETLGLSATTVAKRLRERGYLVAVEETSGTNTVRRTVCGARRRVLHVVADALLGCDDPVRRGESGQQGAPAGQSGHEPGHMRSAPDAGFGALGQIGQISAHIREAGAQSEGVCDDDIPF